MANPEHLAILNQGVTAWNEWRANKPEIEPDLSELDLGFPGKVEVETDDQGREERVSPLDLSRINFFRANLRETNLRGANLTGACLREADLRITDLSFPPFIFSDKTHYQYSGIFGTTLNMANLTKANMTGSNMTFARLENADMTSATLFSTRFVSTSLDGANLENARLAYATFADVDLSKVKGLESIRHGAQSTIGIDTIYKSRGTIPELFLRGCGVPEDMIAYARSLRGKAFEYYSCFISQSAKDKRFCKRLYADLQAKGVRTWYFPEDAKWGESVWGEIDSGIRLYDKLVIVCSENSLQSVPVQREIERALTREDNEHKNILFPITLDQYVFDTWEHQRKADVLAKFVGNFGGWDRDAVKYERAFDKLLKGLQADS